MSGLCWWISDGGYFDEYDNYYAYNEECVSSFDDGGDGDDGDGGPIYGDMTWDLDGSTLTVNQSVGDTTTETVLQAQLDGSNLILTIGPDPFNPWYDDYYDEYNDNDYDDDDYNWESYSDYLDYVFENIADDIYGLQGSDIDGLYATQIIHFVSTSEVDSVMSQNSQPISRVFRQRILGYQGKKENSNMNK